MKSLVDAWAWYTTARTALLTYDRVGKKLWLDEQVCELATRDNHLRFVAQDDVIRGAADALAPLGDLAVLVLFSVFEATLRDELIAQLRSETAKLAHPVVRQAVRDAEDGIENGSFYNRVLSLLKGTIDPDLIESVNQVRRYRNWVAHGRRTAKPDSVTPEVAYERLSEFLAAITPPPPGPTP